jgi:2-polyprenyl-3-methyl-5-hydroxy-6-metoxy-1,4-benzoquinol methylase
VKGLPDFRSDFATIADFLDWWLRHPMLPASQQKTFDGYYAGYRGRFSRYIRHHYSDQSAEITTLIDAGNSPRLLEIGGGCGTEALWFALRGARVLAIDVNEERLGVAQARKEIIERGIGRPLDIEFRFCSLFDLDLPGAFDLIWMEQAFHHVEPRGQIYSTIAHLLAPKGHVVISEANGWNPLLQLVLFRQRGFRTIVDRTTADGQRILYGNERVIIPSAMARGFEEAGIVREGVRYFRALPNIPAAEILMPLERAIPQFAAMCFSHYNYVGRKPAAVKGRR